MLVINSIKGAKFNIQVQSDGNSIWMEFPISRILGPEND